LTHSVGRRKRRRPERDTTYARTRRSALEKENRRPSRFVTEIPSDLLQQDPTSSRPPPELETAAPEGLRPGTVVRHPTFGQGTVVEAGPGGLDQKVTVAFRSVGTKKLIPRYAELEILGQSRGRYHRRR
jgi:DNA helicase-2/ATP-dependent DNA helicase PcrA